MDIIESIAVLDFGSQYSQLIARRIRECKVYSKIFSWDSSASEIAESGAKGIILSGGPSSVYNTGAPMPDPKIFDLGIPVLGICYGLQLTVKIHGGKVARSDRREYGSAILDVSSKDRIFKGLPSKKMKVWMSHGDKVLSLPEGFKALAGTSNTEFAVISNPDRRIYGLQFHPEVVHTPDGSTIIRNFCRDVCACKGLWNMESFIEASVRDIRAELGKDKVVLGLSGGVDSSVAAALINKAVGRQLTCIFVNNGLLRKDEDKKVKDLFAGAFKMNLVYVDATKSFLRKLSGVTDPEQKRKIIGHEFVRVFQKESSAQRGAKFLAQGTTYPDVIESVSIKGNPSALIKSHHNVGGLPKNMKLKLLEPLRCLFKDEVRELGRQLGLPEEIVMRQPFPGPGLAVRLIGAANEKDLEILRNADAIVVEEMKKEGFYYKTWQAFAVLLPVKTVGVMGDERTYENVLALRIVESSDGMTADWSRLPYEFLANLSNRIINEVRGVNRVVYDLTSKPPGTIEWE